MIIYDVYFGCNNHCTLAVIFDQSNHLLLKTI